MKHKMYRRPAQHLWPGRSFPICDAPVRPPTREQMVQRKGECDSSTGGVKRCPVNQGQRDQAGGQEKTAEAVEDQLGFGRGTGQLALGRE